MSKQTAVEWLVSELLDGKTLMPSLIEQAKAMEKEQIINAWMDGLDHIFHKEAGEDYYTQTYGGTND
jgi:hypothetical protein